MIKDRQKLQPKEDLMVCFFPQELHPPSLEAELEKAYRARKQAKELM
jgi:beta-galactosidase beta subunit